MGIESRYGKLKNYLDKDIWTVNQDSLGSIRRRVVHSIRVAILANRTFSAEKIGYQSVALSFFCTMAVVPFLAVALALTNGLGISRYLRALLADNLPNNPEITDYLMTYADNILMKASSSVLGFISAVFFVWLVIWMMLNVEKVFNNVWMVKESRSFATRFWRDVAIVLIAPFLMLMLYGSAILLTGVLKIGWIRWLLLLTLSILTFSAMYKFIPNTQVKYKYAFRAAIFSGIAFTLIQAVYVGSQVFLSRLSGIYGAIAAIPFFMFWLNFSWYVILMGAELSFAFQNVRNYIEEVANESAI